MSKERVKKVVSEPKASLSVPKTKKDADKSKVIKKKTSTKILKAKISPKTKTKITKKSVTKSKKIEITEDITSVTLPPTTPSLRLLEKVELYKRWYHEILPEKVSRSASVFAYVFIGLGTLFATSSHLLNNAEHPAVAAILCSTGVCEEVADEALPQESPVISYLNEIPTQITTDIDFAIDARNTTTYKVYLVNLQNNEKTELKTTAPNDNSNFTVEISTLKQGNYRIEAVTEVEDTSYLFPSNIFSFQPEPKLNNLIEETTLSEEVQDAELVEEDFLDNNDASELTELATDTDLAKDNVEEDLSNETDNESERSNPSVSILIENTANAQYLEVTTGDYLPERVQIYSRLAGVDTDLYLGQAYLVQNTWFFSLSAIELPQNEHKLFAVFEVDGVKNQTESITFNNKDSLSLNTKISEDFSIKKQKIDLALEAAELSNAYRTKYFSNIDTTSTYTPETHFTSADVITEVDNLLSDHTTALNNYLLNYAAAYQGGRLYLIKLAQEQINLYTYLLAEEIADNLNDSNLVTAIETILNQRMIELMTEINAIEDKLKLETNTLLQQDLDQDGISDYDELTNFNTNPNMPDTDQDSILDGVEIVTFSDPSTPDLKNFPHTSSGLKSKINDDISFGSVKRLVMASTDKQHVQYSIAGFGIPNTFVYLSDLENDLIGVIKTNSSGEFFYTIEDFTDSKEAILKAGLVNQYGEYVSSSDNLAYNKKNQLTATIGNVFLMDDKLYSKLTSLNILTGSIALVLLGFILLFLAQSIKARRKKFILKT